MDTPKGMILVVDDDPAVRSVVSRKMQSDGYECVVATDGRDAIEKANEQEFDIVLLDIKMPGPSGMEVLPQLVEKHPDVCVVMITAIIDTQTAVEAMKLGAYDYVTKPFNLDDLGLRVEKALERNRLLKESRERQPTEANTSS